MLKKIALTLLNVFPLLIFVVFFIYGAFVALLMTFPWLLITIINTLSAKSIKEILIYNGILLTSSVVGIFVCGQLYFKHIGYDIEGAMIVGVEMLVASVFILVLTAVECLIKHLYDKKKQ